MVNVTGCCIRKQESVLMIDTSMDDTLMFSSLSVTDGVLGFVELVSCDFPAFVTGAELQFSENILLFFFRTHHPWIWFFTLTSPLPGKQ